MTRELQGILNQFEDVFKAPTELPLDKEHDHAILLKEGAEPVNVRLYCYPHFEKNEIECLVIKMLEAGIIHPSISPFSSPHLMVKKKDGNWRFCVDYRSLNKVTEPDRLPIPNINELHDELHGAKIFTKLYLKSKYHQSKVWPQDVHKTTF